MMFSRVLPLFFVFLVVSAQLGDCGAGQARTNDKKCTPVTYIEGCYRYAESEKCAECEFNYKLTPTGTCNYNERDKKECCLKFDDHGECSECRPGLFLEDGACNQAFLTGCISKDADQCKNCASNFFLRQGACLQAVNGCMEYNSRGECFKCKASFSLAGKECVPAKIIGCSNQQNSTCKKCYSPFSLVGNICTITNCRNLGEFGCNDCAQSFYPKVDGLCYPADVGCLEYNHGECIACSSGYLLRSGKCLVEGCVKEDKGVCKICDVGFENVKGLCKLPNCLKTNNKKCVLCAEGFRIRDGLCVKSTINCVDFVGSICRQCAPFFYIGKDSHCHPVEAGCNEYANGTCKKCTKPFEMDGTICAIDGCIAYDKTGCKQCIKPYLLQAGICKLVNCTKNYKGRCQECNKGFSVDGNGECVKDDAVCAQINKDGKCNKCLTGFFVNEAGKCEATKLGCIYDGPTCKACSRSFKMIDGACVIQGCKTLDVDGCKECNQTYDLEEDKSCKIDGCAEYDANGCTKCVKPYKLVNKACKISNCTKSKNRQCLKCDDGFVVINNQCFEEDKNCVDYTSNGKCKKCKTNYIPSVRGKCVRSTRSASSDEKPTESEGYEITSEDAVGVPKRNKTTRGEYIQTTSTTTIIDNIMPGTPRAEITTKTKTEQTTKTNTVLPGEPGSLTNQVVSDSKTIKTTEVLPSTPGSTTTEIVSDSKGIKTTEVLPSTPGSKSTTETSDSHKISSTEVLPSTPGSTTTSVVSDSKTIKTTEVLPSTPGSTTTEIVSDSKGIKTTEVLPSTPGSKSTTETSDSHKISSTEVLPSTPGSTTTSVVSDSKTIKTTEVLPSTPGSKSTTVSSTHQTVKVFSFDTKPLRIMRKINDNPHAEAGQQPQPQGFIYETVMQPYSTSNPAKPLDYRRIRRLRPIHDSPQPLEGEDPAPEGFVYETVQDVDSPEQRSPDGERVLKFYRRLRKIQPSVQPLANETLIDGFAFDSVSEIVMDNTVKSDYVPVKDFKDLKQKEKPQPIIQTEPIQKKFTKQFINDSSIQLIERPQKGDQLFTDKSISKKFGDNTSSPDSLIKTTEDSSKISQSEDQTKYPSGKKTKTPGSGKKQKQDQMSTDVLPVPEDQSMSMDTESSDYLENMTSSTTKVKGGKKNQTIRPRPNDKKQYMKVIKTQIKVKKFGLCSGEGKIIYSSLLSKEYRKYRINTNIGWRAKFNDSKQWAGLEFMEPFNISQVQIATADDGSYPSEFYIEYSEDANTFKRIPKKIILRKAPVKPVTLQFSEVRALAIRFVITKYVNWPAARFDFLFTDESCTSDEDAAEDTDSNDQYDYESNVVLNKKRTDNKNYVRSMDIVQVDKNRKVIPNDFIDFISMYNASKRVKTQGFLYGSEIGVLSYSSIESEDNLDYGIDGAGWKAENNETGEFFGVIFPYAVTVERLEIRPTDNGEYPTAVKIEYSEDLKTYKTLDKVYPVSNFSSNGVATIQFDQMMYAMEVRAICVDWKVWPAARFEFLYVDERYKQFLQAAKRMKEKMAASKKKQQAAKKNAKVATTSETKTSGTVVASDKLIPKPVPISIDPPVVMIKENNQILVDPPIFIAPRPVALPLLIAPAPESVPAQSLAVSTLNTGSDSLQSSETINSTAEVKKTAFVSRFSYSNLKKFKSMTWKKNSSAVTFPSFYVETSTDGTTFSCWKNCDRQNMDSSGVFTFDPIFETKQIKLHMYPADSIKPDITVSFQFAQ